MNRQLTPTLVLIFGIQFLGFLYYTWYLTRYGYLPSPFIYNKFDSFMDFFNPLYWSENDGRYTVWKSVYPPLNFIFLKLVKLIFLGSVSIADSPTLRASAFPVVVFFIISYLITPILVLRTKLWTIFTRIERTILYFIIISSTPMLFALERGNLIIYTLIFLALVLNSSGLFRAFCIAVLINLKPYLALLVIYYLIRRNWREFWQCILISSLLFCVTGLMLDDNFYLFFRNLLNFSQHGASLPLKEIMAMPSSISAFSYVLNSEAIQLTKYSYYFNVQAIAKIITVIKWLVISWVLVELFGNRNRLSDTQIFAVLLVAITNVGIWVGGYSLIFYVTLLPVFLSMNLRNVYGVILVLMAAPIDIFPFSKESLGDQYSYLSDKIVVVYWTAGLGCVIKPVLNFILLSTLLYEVKQLNEPEPVSGPFNGKPVKHWKE